VKQTPNTQRSTLNAEWQSPQSEFDVQRSTFGVRRWFLPPFLKRVFDLLVAAVFIYAGALKILDPVGFARDIDNYKLVPWAMAVGLGFFLPWLEIFCGLALITRQLYRGALAILTALTIVFITASIIAKARSLDISCGCFGHASKGWSFGWHMVFDVALLAALLALTIAGSKRSTLNASAL